MRDCLFLLADSNMKAAFEGFLTREAFHLSLGCGAFDFDPIQDLFVAAGDNDPGLYTRGHELLRPYQNTHRHAVIVIDAAWDGSPGAEVIRQHLTAKIRESGWEENDFKVIVIDPELEEWIWQQNHHVANALGCNHIQEILDDMRASGIWPEGQAKPNHPKEALETVLRKNRIPRSSSIYQKITSRVSVNHCQDGAFQELLAALCLWFPEEI